MVPTVSAMLKAGAEMKRIAFLNSGVPAVRGRKDDRGVPTT